MVDMSFKDIRLCFTKKATEGKSRAARVRETLKERAKLRERDSEEESSGGEKRRGAEGL